VSDRLRVCVAGSGGKMGRTLVEAVGADKALELAGAFDVGDNVAAAIAAGEVVIDFTRPEGTLIHLARCLELKKAMVIGTTGFSPAQHKALEGAGKKIPIVLSPNFAVGVNAVFKLAETAAKILGDDFDVEIIEAHHRHKVDAPSGTALALGKIISSVLKQDLSKTSVHGRQGDTGVRPRKQIAFHAIRGGDIVGEHTVIFAGVGERVEVTVRSQSRMTYALGALRAAKFLRGKGAGLYGMEDVLNLGN
jgi:4-hydroxy-tetrahydrodipicolinate reductase